MIFKNSNTCLILRKKANIQVDKGMPPCLDSAVVEDSEWRRLAA